MARKKEQQPPLRLLPGGHVTPVPRCQLGTLAIMAGFQDLRVEVRDAHVTGKRHGVIEHPGRQSPALPRGQHGISGRLSL